MEKAQKCLLWLLAFQAACGLDTDYLAELRKVNARLSQQGDTLRQMQVNQNRLKEDLSDGLAVALCRPEVRQLVDDVTKECVTRPSEQLQSQNGALVAAHSEVQLARTTEAQRQTVGDTCDTKKIEPAVIGADPEHRGRLLRLMISLRHEVFYMRPNASELISFRRDKLQRLATQRLLLNTHFIIVSYYDRKEPGYRAQAIRRAELVRDKLRFYNNDVDLSRIQIWLYSEAFRASEIVDRVDLPQSGEPQDFSHSAWVFRADC